MPWTWRYEDHNGVPIAPDGAPADEFPSQSDAESWLGEHWRALLDQGVEQVTLLENDTVVYGPMSLRPPD